MLSTIGQASYHIFLVQMVYYHFELGGKIMKQVWYLAVPYNLVITIGVGLIFYRLESKYVGSGWCWNRFLHLKSEIVKFVHYQMN